MANDKPRQFRPLIRWHGGKWMIALWVLDYFPRHHLYTEVFGGGASVLLRKWRAKAEIYNDLDATLVQLFRVIRDPAQAAALIRLLEITPYARDEFEAAYACAACGEPIYVREAHVDCQPDPVEMARRTIVRSYMGYGGDGANGHYRTGFRATVTSHLKLPAQEWASYPFALRTIVERLRGVVIENRPAVEILERFDGPGTLHYVDPPYLPETRSAGNRRRGQGYHVYEHELDTADHVELLERLVTLEGMVVLSGYPSALYDKALAGWERVERPAYADGGRPRTEVLWINPAARDARLSGRRPQRKSAAPPGPLFREEDDGIECAEQGGGALGQSRGLGA